MSNNVFTEISNTRSIYTGHKEEIYRIIFYNNDEKFITCSRDKKIKFFDRLTGECLNTLSGHRGVIKCMLLMTNGMLVTGCCAEFIKIW